LLQPVGENSEVHFVPAIAGGADPEDTPPVPTAYTCTVCGRQGESTLPGQRLCPACREEFYQWMAQVLQPLCKTGEDPLKKLYCFPRD
jgi:hypothetical protein